MAEHILFEGTGPDGWRWVHMRRSPETEAALLADPEVPDAVAWALLEQDTLPRAAQVDSGTLLILRGINLVPGADPEDMISLRLWITPGRIVSTEIRRLSQTDTMIAAFHDGKAPASPDAFVLALVESLRASAEPVLDQLEDRVSDMESLVAAPVRRLGLAERRVLSALRQDAILLHRFIAPQALALDGLSRAAPGWLTGAGALREEAEAFRRIAADLDALRQRAQLVAEEISLAATERTNEIMLTLSVVSVIFLPLTFLTGLLGVNLAGIPFATDPFAFWAFCGLLTTAAGLSLWLAARLLR
ncbi:MAG TPA: CorA family divalent cation transporter [Thermohalobaculum sp.]|nr:CorA family divalent cation transporter [Thermohalobaculum sp.]